MIILVQSDKRKEDLQVKIFDDLAGLPLSMMKANFWTTSLWDSNDASGSELGDNNAPMNLTLA